MGATKGEDPCYNNMYIIWCHVAFVFISCKACQGSSKDAVATARGSKITFHYLKTGRTSGLHASCRLKKDLQVAGVPSFSLPRELFVPHENTSTPFGLRVLSNLSSKPNQASKLPGTQRVSKARPLRAGSYKLGSCLTPIPISASPVLGIF